MGTVCSARNAPLPPAPAGPRPTTTCECGLALRRVEEWPCTAAHQTQVLRAAVYQRDSALEPVGQPQRERLSFVRPEMRACSTGHDGGQDAPTAPQDGIARRLRLGLIHQRKLQNCQHAPILQQEFRLAFPRRAQGHSDCPPVPPLPRVQLPLRHRARQLQTRSDDMTSVSMQKSPRRCTSLRA
jgi:hypothetical protein